MRFLLDTHAFIWAASDPDRLSPSAATAMADPNNDLYLSAVSGWEVAIKRARGRLRFPAVDASMVDALSLVELPVSLLHAAEVGGLPDHHRDPFDRMLIAQARVEDLTVISRDSAFGAYGVRTHW